MGDPDGALDSWLWPGPTLAIVAIGDGRFCLSHIISLLLCLSNKKYIKKISVLLQYLMPCECYVNCCCIFFHTRYRKSFFEHLDPWFVDSQLQNPSGELSLLNTQRIFSPLLPTGEAQLPWQQLCGFPGASVLMMAAPVISSSW